jgi:hypothetical protein
MNGDFQVLIYFLDLDARMEKLKVQDCIHGEATIHFTYELQISSVGWRGKPLLCANEELVISLEPQKSFLTIDFNFSRLLDRRAI